MDHLVGLPYLLGGRTREGVDCLGLVLMGLEARGVPTFDPWSAFEQAFRDGWRDFVEAMPAGWLRVPTDRLQDDDVVIFTRSSHVALVVDHGKRLLTTTPDGGLSASIALEPRRRLILSAWRHETRC